MFDTEKFIRCVRANPAIWDRRSKDYQTRHIRQESWTLIGKRMYKNWDSLPDKDKDHKVYEMRNRWRHVRDAYARHVNGNKTKGGKNKRKYIYADNLSFLPTKWSSSPTPNETVPEEDNIEIENESGESDDSSQDGLSSGNQQLGVLDEPSQGDPLGESAFEPTSSSDTNCLIKSEPLIEEIVDPDLADSTQYSVCPEQPWKKPGTSQFAASTTQISALEELEVLRQIEADPDRAFLLSLLPDIKRLSDDEKLEFRIHILQFIRNIQKKKNISSSNSDQHEEIPQSENVLKKVNNVKIEYDEDMEGVFLHDTNCI